MPIRQDTSFELVRDDVLAALAEIFEPRGDETEMFGVREELEVEGEEQEVISNGTLVAVPWVYRCRHTGDFQGLFPTGRDLRIDGVTLVDRSHGEALFYRYIDWAGVISQLGLMVSARVPVTEEEYAAGLAHLHS